MRTFLITLVCAGAAMAQSTRVAGPVSGIVFDARTHALRPMVGVPGASYLGDALLSGIELAAVAPDGDRALAVVEGRLMLVSGLSTGAVMTAAVDGAIEGVTQIAWSNGDAAVLAGATLAQSFRKGAAGAPIELPFRLTALAAGDDGEVIAGADGGVYLLAPGSAPRLLAALAQPSAIAARGTSLYAADSATGQLWLISNFATSASAAVFADGIDSPVGVRVSADGKRIVVASAAKAVRVFDAATRAATRSVELDVMPTELASFGGRDVWLLNSNAAGADPLYVATGGDDAASYFVPAGREQ